MEKFNRSGCCRIESTVFHNILLGTLEYLHLYQAILNGEDHVKDLAFFTTLAGYIHWRMTGEKVLGVGDASGMFPIDPKTKQYDAVMMDKFEDLIADRHFAWHLADILPEIRLAGESAGSLTAEGAKLLDPSGELE